MYQQPIFLGCIADKTINTMLLPVIEVYVRLTPPFMENELDIVCWNLSK